MTASDLSNRCEDPCGFRGFCFLHLLLCPFGPPPKRGRERTLAPQGGATSPPTACPAARLRAALATPTPRGGAPQGRLRLLASGPRLWRSPAGGMLPPDPEGFAPWCAFAHRAPRFLFFMMKEQGKRSASGRRRYRCGQRCAEDGHVGNASALSTCPPEGGVVHSKHRQSRGSSPVFCLPIGGQGAGRSPAERPNAQH